MSGNDSGLPTDTPAPEGWGQGLRGPYWLLPPLRTSRWRGPLDGLLGALTYLAVTLVCLGLAWLLPGRGLEVVTARVLLGCWLPGLALLLGLPALRRTDYKAAAVGALVAALGVGLALGGVAIAVAVVFRIGG